MYSSEFASFLKSSTTIRHKQRPDDDKPSAKRRRIDNSNSSSDEDVIDQEMIDQEDQNIQTSSTVDGDGMELAELPVEHPVENDEEQVIGQQHDSDGSENGDNMMVDVNRRDDSQFYDHGISVEREIEIERRRMELPAVMMEQVRSWN